MSIGSRRKWTAASRARSSARGNRHPRRAVARIAVSPESRPFTLGRRAVSEAVGPAALLTAAVGAYIASAYWCTSSTSFANPAVTIARAATDTFAGIRPQDVPAFLIAQAVGAGAAAALFGWIDFSERGPYGAV